jgi:hypothetical protein
MLSRIRYYLSLVFPHIGTSIFATSLFLLVATFGLLTPALAQTPSQWEPQPGWGLETISVDENGNPGNHTGGVSAWQPFLSGNGRYVLFVSRATNFVPGGDSNGTGADAILHDRQTGQKEYASLTWDGNQPGGQGSFVGGISADGRYVLFNSYESNVAQGVTNTNPNIAQIYLRDRQNATTELISGDNGVIGNGFSSIAGISDDGRYVVYTTNAENLIPGGLQGDERDVVLLDRNTGQRELISQRTDGSRFGNTSLTAAHVGSSISSDGRYVVFATKGTDSGSGDTNSRFDVYLRDRTLGTTTWISNNVPADFVNGNAGCYDAALSPNGNFIAYLCDAYDLQQNNGYSGVFFTDRTTGQTTLASLNNSGNRVGHADYPSVSPDGRYVGFRWLGSPFTGGQVDQVAIRDREASHTALLTQTPDGNGYGNRYGYYSSFSGDSSLVTFATLATNISAPYVPPANTGNVFVRPLPYLTATPTPTVTPTPTDTPTPTPTETPTPTPTATPTATPTPTDTPTPTPTPAPRQLTTLSPANLWMSKPIGDFLLRVDVLAEAYKDNTLVSSGQLNSVTVGTIFGTMTQISVPFNSFTPVNFPTGSQLKLKVSARNACSGSLDPNGTVRLFYNDNGANSRFDATIEGSNSDYYLRSAFALATTVGGGPRQNVSVSAGSQCSAFKTFGTWTITP